jgi:hypothetical protein
MARIRTIKPDFFTSEDIVSLTPMARLLFIALWCEADKRGRMSWKPTTFKMRYLPGDTCDIEVLCRELVGGGLVRLYGDGLAYIPSFEKHQHVNPRETESTMPDPEGWRDTGPKKVGKTLREAVFERDGHQCVRCGSNDKLQVDHILPQSCGGPHIMENLRTLCRGCNAGRPVQGPVLDADLKKDGYSVKSLQVKFGIDASIHGVHAQGGREGKGKEGYTHASRTRKVPLPADFGISEAIKAWAAEKGHDRLELHLESFRAKATAKGYQYANWDAAFMEAVRENWANLPASNVAVLPEAGGRRRLG